MKICYSSITPNKTRQITNKLPLCLIYHVSGFYTIGFLSQDLHRLSFLQLLFLFYGGYLWIILNSTAE